MSEALLSGKTALVTGASRGIGAAIAVALASAGARVALVARTESALKKVAERIGDKSVVIVADLTEAASVTHVATAFAKDFGGPPDILVSNAGLFQLEPIESLATGEFEDTIRTNLFVPFHLFRAFLAGMRARGSGDIVTIGSIADRTIFPGNGAYAASKHGARALHEVLRTETRGTGVRATLVSPAGVDTALWDNIRLPESDAPPDRTMMMRPEAVADAVLYAVTRPREVNVDELRLSRT